MQKSAKLFGMARLATSAITLMFGAAVLLGCGSAGAAGDGLGGVQTPAANYRVAPIYGSPEEAALELQPVSGYAAPIEGSPEATAVDLGRWP
jgi:hypothetical protein